MPEFRKILDISPYLQGTEIRGYGICYDGSLAVAVAAQRETDLTSSSSSVRENKPLDITVLRSMNGSIQTVKLAPCDVTNPHVQVMPDNSILIVSSRCQFKNDTYEQNAWLFSPVGGLLRRFCLGDGIERVQVSRQGEIWVSFFDEGVYGNDGWMQPLAHSGLACFDNHGKPIWSYTPPKGFGHIDDCNAMSVCGDSVYLCYYSSFPIVAINQAKEVAAWNNEVGGARAIASDGKRVMLYGGDPEQSRCVIQSLGKDRSLHDRTQFTVPYPFAKGGMNVVGHDSDLHVVADNIWYRLSIDEFP